MDCCVNALYLSSNPLVARKTLTTAGMFNNRPSKAAGEAAVVDRSRVFP
jgi:hypothetical protein